MLSSAGCRDDYTSQEWKDRQLTEVCKKHGALSREDVALLIEVSHTLPFVSNLEGGDIFIDILSVVTKQAIVAAQFSPADGNFYNHDIVGEPMLRSNEPGVYRTLEIGAPSRKLKAVVDGDCIIRQNVSPITNPDGEIIGVLIVERSIQAGGVKEGDANTITRIQAAYDVKEMEHIAEYMNDGVVRLNADGIVVYINSMARKIYLGLEYMDDLIGMDFENIAFGNMLFTDIKYNGRNEHTEIKIGQYILNVLYAPIMDGEIFTGAVILIEDTTEEKNIEKELILKAVAIEEIHHRVKNNLQTIVSLIRLQARRNQQGDVQKVCEEIISRIFSIALTHEILAQTGMDGIDIREMLARMLNSAKGFFVPENLDLTLEITGDCLLMKSDAATAIGMVVNELVQNCIKHAFVGRDKGRITLTITKGEVYSNIIISDDGIGFDSEIQKNGCLGHKLVNSLIADKLFGELMMFSTNNGTQVYFDFMTDVEGQRQKSKEAEIREMLESLTEP